MEVFKTYSNRLNEKFESDKASNINNLIIFFNWCFKERNNFFNPDFNHKYVKNVCITYGTIKTNILKVGPNSNIFNNISDNELRRIKFILSYVIFNYYSLCEKPENKELFKIVSKKSLIECNKYINVKLKELLNEKLEKTV